jgi:hypothetical protein
VVIADFVGWQVSNLRRGDLRHRAKQTLRQVLRNGVLGSDPLPTTETYSFRESVPAQSVDATPSNQLI